MFDDKQQTSMRNYFKNQLSKLGVVKKYKKNEIIYTNANDLSFGIVLKGKVIKSIVSKQGKQKMMYTLRPGEIFGEMNLFCGRSLDYLIKVKEEAEISYINWDVLQKVLQTEPHVYRYFIHSITRKFRITTLQLTNHTFNDSTGKVADALLRLAACSENTVKPENTGIISTALTQDELASNVGCSRITVTRVINKFVKEKLISIKDKKIIINDMETLANYTDRFI